MDYNDKIIEIGKVRNYDNLIGEIVSKSGTFFFTSSDLETGEFLNENDIVMFRGEKIHNTQRAFFIKKLNPKLNLEEQVLTKTKRLKENE